MDAVTIVLLVISWLFGVVSGVALVAVLDQAKKADQAQGGDGE